MATDDLQSEDKHSLPGFVYLQDDGRDLKLGITRNLGRRLQEYITENPRLKLYDSFEADSLAHAEQIEAELIKATAPYRTHGNEWCSRCDEVFRVWEELARKYARRTYDEWLERRSDVELERCVEFVASAAAERFANGDERGFCLPSHPDLYLCPTNYFDGSLIAARRIVFEAIADEQGESTSAVSRWGGEDADLVIVKSGYLRFLQEKSLGKSQAEASYAKRVRKEARQIVTALGIGAIVYLAWVAFWVANR